MPKTKLQKQETINDLKDNLTKAKSVVFADIQGLKAKDLVSLRRKIKETKGSLKVAKKTLIDLALKQSQNETANAKDMTGEIAIVFSFEDEIKPLKASFDFSKEYGLKLVAGIFNGLFMNQEEVMALAQLPSKQELLAKLLGSISNPLSGFANVLQGNLKGLVYLLSNIKK